jgi:hypothetical protein
MSTGVGPWRSAGEERARRGGIAARGNEHVNDLPMVVDRAV